jgi:regulator of nucleoside diphosphate kinase
MVMLLSRRVMSVNDHGRLVEAVRRANRSWLTYAPHLDVLRAELRRSRAVPPEEVPDDMVTMNSRVAVADVEGRVRRYTLVYPEDEAPEVGFVSALSPLGMALLGAGVGDEVCWLSAAGPEVGTIEDLLYQPEAAAREAAGSEPRTERSSK